MKLAYLETAFILFQVCPACADLELFSRNVSDIEFAN